MNNQVADHELGWDSSIERDSVEYVLLKDGEYPFTVREFKRGRHEGSEKLPPCNKAILTIEIDGGEQGCAVLTHNLFLHSRCESLLSAFFVSIGLKKKGEALNMGAYWTQLVGKTGRCKVKQRKWTSDRDGKEHTSNEIDRFLEPAAAPAKGWTAGKF